MTLDEFVSGLADVEGKEALEKYVKDFWQQASDEDRKAIILGIESLAGHIRKVVKSFWELCGIAYSNGWVTVDGKSYAITPEIKADNGGLKLYNNLALNLQPSAEKGKHPHQVEAAEQYHAARKPEKIEGVTKPIRTLAGGVRSEALEDGRVVIKNDVHFKVKGE
jgi:hypothetical protein